MKQHHANDRPAAKREPATRYRRVETRTWSDDRFRLLTPLKPSGQALWLYLLTGPFTTNVPGLLIAGQAAMAEALGWPLKAFRACWDEIASRGMAKADWPNRIVWLPNAVKHNGPASPNVVLSWKATIADTTECPLKVEALTTLKAHLTSEGYGPLFLHAMREVLPKAFHEGLPEALPKAMQQSGSGSGAGTGTGFPPTPQGVSASPSHPGPDRNGAPPLLGDCDRCATVGATTPATGRWTGTSGRQESLCERHLDGCRAVAERLRS